MELRSDYEMPAASTATPAASSANGGHQQAQKLCLLRASREIAERVGESGGTAFYYRIVNQLIKRNGNKWQLQLPIPRANKSTRRRCISTFLLDVRTKC